MPGATMFFSKNHKQLNILDAWAYLGPKRRKMLDDSWAGLFRGEILPELPVDELREYYDECQGRPTKELCSMMGLMILQQMHDLSDEEAVQQFCFSVQWRYALDITDDSDAHSYVSLRSLWTMRDHLIEKGLDKTLLDKIVNKLAKVFKVALSKQRMDSVHIHSNMRRLGRIGLFVKTIKKFLVNLKRHHPGLLDELDEALRTRYLDKKQEAVFSLVKPTQARKTLDQLVKDVFVLVERFSSVDGVNDMSSFKLLVRLFQEQCIVENHAGARIPAARPSKEVPSNSLQNPSDPDAGYSGHKGQGFQAQVMETYDPEGSEESFSLITYVEVEPADHSDANALLPALAATKERGVAPQELLLDSLYGSDENCERAKADYGVEVISPAMGAAGEGLSIGDFTLEASDRIVACPQGRVPLRVTITKAGFSAAFSLADCEACPRRKDCPAKLHKRAAYVRYTPKQVRLARRRVHEQTPEFREKYRFRAGAEATMSEYDRRTGVKKLRVRGLEAVSYAAVMKAIGLNIRRAAAAQMQPGGPKKLRPTSICALIWVIFHLTEQIRGKIEMFRRRILQNRPDRWAYMKIAA
jgi:hypothetical protein